MQAIAAMYQSMDQTVLMKAMMGGAPGAGGGVDGLFGGEGIRISALDELSEGEE